MTVRELLYLPRTGLRGGALFTWGGEQQLCRMYQTDGL
jgi:hypothetical protein